MPTFDFHCQDCEHIFEFSRPFGSGEIPPCPECSSANTEKQIAAPAVVFKGEGFYKTDSATDSAPKEAPRGTPDSDKDSVDKGETQKSEKKASESAPKEKGSQKGENKV